MEEKDKFWTDLDEVVENILKEERVVIGPDCIGHVEDGNIGDENIMGMYGDKARDRRTCGGGSRDKSGNGCG